MEHNSNKFSEWWDFAHIEKENSLEKLKQNIQKKSKHMLKLYMTMNVLLTS